jgi:hypothetical protein
MPLFENHGFFINIWNSFHALLIIYYFVEIPLFLIFGEDVIILFCNQLKGIFNSKSLQVNFYNSLFNTRYPLHY